VALDVLLEREADDLGAAAAIRSGETIQAIHDLDGNSPGHATRVHGVECCHGDDGVAGCRIRNGGAAVMLPAGFEDMSDEQLFDAMVTNGPYTAEDAEAVLAQLRRGAEDELEPVD